MSLSLSNIYDIFLKHVNHEKIEYYFTNFIFENYSELRVPSVFKNYKGMDSKVCYIVLLECEKKSVKLPKGFTELEIAKIYGEVYKLYCDLHTGKAPTISSLERNLKIKELLGENLAK